jgi:hypothetical protein
VVFPSVDVCHHHYLPFQLTGQKRTAEEYFQTAEANGDHEGDHRVVLEQDEPSDRYKLNQQEALDQWVM